MQAPSPGSDAAPPVVSTGAPALSTVFVVDDDPGIRDSLQWLIGSVGLPVELFGTADEFLRYYDGSRPGCLVLDIRLPDMSGLQLQEELQRRGFAVPLIVISGYAEVPVAVRAMKAGAIDFIEKPFSDQTLLGRIQQAIELDLRTRASLARRAEAERRLSLLSRRERQVMELVVAGRSNKAIASSLGLSPKTVEVHRAQVMKKLHVDSLAELVRLVLSSHKDEPIEPDSGSER